MIVVADSSPLNYLILIGQVQTLPVLYTRVAVPDAVREELCQAGAPLPVKEWMKNPLEIHRLPPTVESAIAHLDFGEQQAITLAGRIHAEHILIDDLQVRVAAKLRGLSVIGTVGILQRASREGLLDFQCAFHDLAATNFRMSPAFRLAIQKKLENG